MTVTDFVHLGILCHVGRLLKVFQQRGLKVLRGQRVETRKQRIRGEYSFMNCSSSDERRAICSCFRMYLWNFSIYVKDASSDHFVEANAQVADKEVLNPFDIHLHSHAVSNALLHRASS